MRAHLWYVEFVKHAKTFAFVLCLSACGGSQDGLRRSSDGNALSGSSGSSKGSMRDPGGFVTYMVNDTLYRVEAVQGARPVDVSERLSALSEGSDEAPSVSKNGSWMTIVTTRFGCGEQGCLAVVPRDLSRGSKVLVGRDPIFASGRGAISNDGRTIVFTWNEGPHALDLYVTKKGSTDWSKPVLLTADSPFKHNTLPAMNAAGTQVVFDCGNAPYAEAGTNICRVNTDGSNFKKLLLATGDPLRPGDKTRALHHADFGPDGSIIFEADWGGEHVWILPPGSKEPKMFGPGFDNDNSPCVLPSGHVASLWLGDPEGNGLHELKVMDRGGGDALLLTPLDLDVSDVGISCHGPLSN